MAKRSVPSAHKSSVLCASIVAVKCNIFPDRFICKRAISLVKLCCVKLLKEVFLTEFVIHGTLDENKNLVFAGNPTCNQGENATTKLSVTVPNALTEEVDFYFEFLCPHHNWVSPKATATVQGENTVVTYLLGGNVLQEEGTVSVQLVARSKADCTVLYKSVIGAQSVIFVAQSVNYQTSAQAQDFYGEALGILQEVESKNYVTTEMLTPLLPTTVGQLENDVGYVTADEVSNKEICIRTAENRLLGKFYLNDAYNHLVTVPVYEKSTATIYQGDVQVGQFKINQAESVTIRLDKTTSSSSGGSTPNNAKVTVYQGGQVKGTFTLNQTANTAIFLDGSIQPTCFGDTYQVEHNGYCVIDDVANRVVELIVSPDEDTYVQAEDGTESGLVATVTLNGVEIVLPDQVYNDLKLVPQCLHNRWVATSNGTTVGYVPYESPDEGYDCLAVKVTTDTASGACYVHYSAR